MCYGMGCWFENFYGECTKPYREPCPMDDEEENLVSEWEKEKGEEWEKEWGEELERELFDKKEEAGN